MQIIRVETRDSLQHKSTCELIYRDGYLILSIPETKSEWMRLPASQVQYRLGGNRDRLVFMTSPLLGETTLYFELNTDSRKEIGSHPRWAEQLREPLAKHGSDRWVTLAVVALLVVAFSLVIGYRRAIFGGMAQFIPFSAEKKIADQVFNPKMTEPQLKALEKIKPVFDRLKFDRKDWPHEFTFHISSATEPNAYATLGGHIFVNKGLITALEKTEDLLGVVAHEMIHVQQRHVARSAVQAMGLYLTLSIFFGDVSGLSAVLIDQGAPLLNLQYSRTMEEEADQMAVDLMVANQIDPLGLARSLRVISDEQSKLIRQAPGSEVLEKFNKIEILSSHPDIDGRIKAIHNKAKFKAPNQIFQDVPFDFAEWKAEIKDAF